MSSVTDCLQSSLFPLLLDSGREIAEFGEGVTSDVADHLKKIPATLHRVEAQTDKLISLSDYSKVVKLQDYAQSHIGKKIALAIGSLSSTIVQNLSQAFQSVNTYPTFTNVVAAPAFTLAIQVFGTFMSALSFVVAAYSTYKAVVLKSIINNLTSADTKLDETHEPTKKTYQLAKDVLTLERNKAIRNIALSALSIAVFILGNFVSMGIPLMAVIGCCILVAAVKICMDIKATRETDKLCAELQKKITIAGYGSGWDDEEFKKLMALVIPVIQKETGYCFDPDVMNYAILVHRSHVA